MQTELTFYRNAAVPLPGTTPSNPWKYAGNALTASSVFVFPSEKGIKSATWIVVWDPNAGAGYNACRLVTADDGPSNLEQIAFINKNNTNTPIVSSFDITLSVRAILDGGVRKQIIMQTCGDTPSKIYRSSIDILWDD